MNNGKNLPDNFPQRRCQPCARHRGTGDRNCLRCVDDRDRSKASETEISDYFLERRKPKYGDQGVNKEVKKETKNRIRIISWILFVIYIGLLVYFLFLSEEYGRTSFDQRIYRYNLTPFQEIKRFWIYRHRVGFWVAFLNLAGNVIGFLPFGFFSSDSEQTLTKRSCGNGSWIWLKSSGGIDPAGF